MSSGFSNSLGTLVFPVKDRFSQYTSTGLGGVKFLKGLLPLRVRRPNLGFSTLRSRHIMRYSVLSLPPRRWSLWARSEWTR